MIPSAPSPTRAASSSSPAEISRTSPRPSTSRSDSTREDRFPKASPVPWVAVASAPASAWVSMSPWFSSARPRPSSASPSALIEAPACTRTRPVEGSASSTASIPDRSTITPSVQAMSVNE